MLPSVLGIQGTIFELENPSGVRKRKLGLIAGAKIAKYTSTGAENWPRPITMSNKFPPPARPRPIGAAWIGSGLITGSRTGGIVAKIS